MVSLREFRGKAVVLAFHPADWSPVCGDQMALYNEMLSEFKGLNAQLLGISVDGSWCHAAFSKDRKLHFPILADSEPKGAVARQYGVWLDRAGSQRAGHFVSSGENPAELWPASLNTYRHLFCGFQLAFPALYFACTSTGCRIELANAAFTMRPEGHMLPLDPMI